MEIDLLKKLNHENIVKYLGYTKTKDYLNIYLEYVENGSLQSMQQKFGKFPEGLASMYIDQVLKGLVYLHDQGVIHRGTQFILFLSCWSSWIDIKGANILITKSSVVKLADFGVATNFGEGGKGDLDIAGSPYWSTIISSFSLLVWRSFWLSDVL